MAKSIFGQLLIALMLMAILNIVLIASISLNQGNALMRSANDQRTSYVRDYLQAVLEAPLARAQNLINHLEALVLQDFSQNTSIDNPSNLKRFIDNHLDEVKRLAQNHEDSKTAYIYLDPRLTGQSLDIYFADQDSDGLVERQNPLDPSRFAEANSTLDTMAWWFGALNTQDIFWTSPYTWTYDNGQKAKFISVTRAIRLKGQVIGVVGTDISLDQLTQHLAASGKITGGTTYLMDATGTPIYLPADTSESQLMAAIANPATYEHIDITLSNGWRIGLLTLVAENRAPYNRFIYWLLIISAIAILQALTIATIVSHLLSKPLREIAHLVANQHNPADALVLNTAILKRKDEIGRVAQALVGMSDAIKANQSTIEHQRKSLEFLHQRDDLTHLPNKEYLYYRSKELKILLHKSQVPHLVVVMNIDNFRLLNGLLGTNLCNRVLIEIGKRLSELTPKPLLVARTSGDEFVLIQPLDAGASAETDLLERLRAILGGVYILSGDDVHLSLSMGASKYPDHGQTVDALIKCAAIALNAVKNNNKGHFALYDPAISEMSQDQFELLKRLRDALATGNLQLYYQPQIDATSGACVGAEALLRWELDGRQVPPLAFIPLAEESKLIIPLGDLVIQKAFAFSRHLTHLGYPLKLSINISSGQITWDHLHRVLAEAVKQHQVSPDQIALEITESLIVDGQKTALEVLRALHDIGFDIAIDDFGTGYSSLSYLKSIPFSTLKLDRMFIKDYPAGDDGAIAKMIVALAKDLGAVVVAEGMETEAQRDFLLACGCDIMQGYYYSKPLCEADFIAFLQKGPSL